MGTDIIWFSCCSSRCLPLVSDVFGSLSTVEKVILRGTVFEGKYEQPLQEIYSISFEAFNINIEAGANLTCIPSAISDGLSGSVVGSEQRYA